MYMAWEVSCRSSTQKKTQNLRAVKMAQAALEQKTVSAGLTELLVQGFPTDQHDFVLRFSRYLVHDARKDFIVHVDDIWDCLGLSNSTAASRGVLRFLEPGVDFAHGQQQYLTIQGFKNLCTCLGTTAAKKARELYGAMEEIMLEFTKRELKAQKEALQARQEELDRLKEKTFEMVPRYESVYIHKAAAELGSDRHKIGKSLDPRRRESQLNTSLAQGGKILYSVETYNAEIVEKAVGVILKRYHYWREHYQCQLEHSINVLDAVSTVIDTLSSCYHHITRAELFDRVVDALVHIKTSSTPPKLNVQDDGRGQDHVVQDQDDANKNNKKATTDDDDENEGDERDPLSSFLDTHIQVISSSHSFDGNSSEDDHKLSRTSFVKRQDLVQCLLAKSPFGCYLKSLSRTELNQLLDKAMAAKGCPFRDDTNAMGGHRLRRVYRGCVLVKH